MLESIRFFIFNDGTAFSNPISKRSAKPALTNAFKQVYTTLRGIDKSEKPAPAAQHIAWWELPYRQRLGLLDYALTLPVEALSFVFMVGSGIAGALALDIAMLLLILKAEKQGNFNFATFALFFWMFGGSRDSGVVALALAAVAAALAYCIAYPIRWFVGRALVPALAAIIAAPVSLFVYAGQWIADCLGWTAAPAETLTDQTPAYNGPSSTAQLTQRLNVNNHRRPASNANMATPSAPFAFAATGTDNGTPNNRYQVNDELPPPYDYVPTTTTRRR